MIVKDHQYNNDLMLFRPGWRINMILSAVLLLPIFLCIFRMPSAWNDMIFEVVGFHTTAFMDAIPVRMITFDFYYRPFEFILRYVVKWFFDSDPVGYSVMAAVFLYGIVLFLLMMMSPRSLREYCIAVIAIAILLGHQSLGGTLEYNIVISNLFTMLLLSILMWYTIQRQGSSNWVIMPILILGLMTKEVGIVLFAYVIGSGVLRLTQIKWSTIVIALTLGLSYVVYKFAAVRVSDGLNNFGNKGGIQFDEFIVNILATPMNVLTGFPKGGDFGAYPILTGFDYPLWQYVHLISGSLLLFLVLAAALVGVKTVYTDPRSYRLWFLLLLMVLGTIASISFFYTTDRHGAMAVPLLIYLFYIASAHLLAVQPNYRIPTWCVVSLVLILTSLWTVRMVGTSFYLRELSGRIRMSWYRTGVDYFGGRYGFNEEGMRVVQMYYDNAINSKAPLVWLDPDWVKETFGGENSVNR